MDQLSSQELSRLVKKAQNGSKKAFREIFERLSNKFFAYVHSRTSNRDDALDIVQETFIELWDALKRFKYKSKQAFYGFIFTIIKRKLYRYYKYKQKFVPLNEKVISDSHEMKTENYQYLLKHVNALAQKHQDLLRLRYWSGMTFGEIASVLNIKETTAKVWHHRAIKKLQALLEKYGNTI
ncbi:MAG: RNA polymerase sigma factor [Candidatus Aminicenantia bacterium]